MWCNLLDLNGTDSPFSILQGSLWPAYWTQIGPRFLGTLGDLPVTLVIDTGFEGVMFFANRLPDGLKNLPEPASSPSLVHESDCARGVRGGYESESGRTAEGVNAGRARRITSTRLLEVLKH